MYFSKNKTKKIAEKIFSLFLIISVAAPSLTLAAETTTTSTGTTNGSSITTKNETTSSGSEKTYSGAGSAVGSAVGTCSVGQILANIVGSTVATGINAITSAVTGLVTDSVSSLVSLKVPVSDSTTNKNTGRLTTAKVGGGDQGGIIQNFLNGIGSVSLDSIAFCIANEMIKYIGESTISWIKGGFKGNPVFVDNPSKFFTNIADQEAGAFIQTLVASTTGINVCQPFKVSLAVKLIDDYSSSSKSTVGCSLDTIKNNYQGFVNGNFSSGGLPGWFELIEQQNNYWGANEIAQSKLNAKITTKTNTAKIELDWSKGYKSFKICTNGKNTDGSCKPNADGTSGEKTTTLGGYIEHTVNARSTSPQRRLEIAQTFDGVVSALVNELIKIAVNKVFDTDSTTDSTTSLSAYCSTLPDAPKVGDPVYWSAAAYGGDGDYSYSWSGDVYGVTSGVSTFYTTEGTKTAVVTITSGDQTTYRTCSINVYPRTTTNTNTNTQTSTTPTISSLSPTSGPVGTQVTITGSGFTSTNNLIKMDNGNDDYAGSFNSSNGTNITFTVPNNIGDSCLFTNSNVACAVEPTNVIPGTYSISVKNSKGVSNSKTFTVTSSSNGASLIIRRLDPTSGPIGRQITIWSDVTGNDGGFPAGQYDMLMDGRWAETVNNTAFSTSLVFTIPTTTSGGCSGAQSCTGVSQVIPGTYSIAVQNSNNVRSNSLNLTVTAQ